MKYKKGITVLEVILSIMMIGLASTLVIKVINLYSNQNGVYETSQSYNTEKVKAIYQLMVTTRKKTNNKKLLKSSDRYEVYVDEELVLWCNDNTIYTANERMTFDFKYLNDFECVIDNNYLVLYFNGVKGRDKVFVRWIYE